MSHILLFMKQSPEEHQVLKDAVFFREVLVRFCVLVNTVISASHKPLTPGSSAHSILVSATTFY